MSLSLCQMSIIIIYINTKLKLLNCCLNTFSLETESPSTLTCTLTTGFCIAELQSFGLCAPHTLHESVKSDCLKYADWL